MSDKKLIEFNDLMVSVNIVLDEEGVERLKEDLEKVESWQAPLIGTHKNGFTVFIPWILKEDT